jgi:hypothetical protein
MRISESPEADNRTERSRQPLATHSFIEPVRTFPPGPSVWSLTLVGDLAPAMFPVLVHQQEDEELWLLEFQLTPAANAKPIPTALVVVGHSPEI